MSITRPNNALRMFTNFVNKESNDIFSRYSSDHIFLVRTLKKLDRTRFTTMT